MFSLSRTVVNPTFNGAHFGLHCLAASVLTFVVRQGVVRNTEHPFCEFLAAGGDLLTEVSWLSSSFPEGWRVKHLMLRYESWGRCRILCTKWDGKCRILGHKWQGKCRILGCKWQEKYRILGYKWQGMCHILGYKWQGKCRILGQKL